MNNKYNAIVDISDKVISISMEEYKIRTNEILKRVELQSGLVRMQTALVSAVIAAIIALITKVTNYHNELTLLLLLAPFPFYFLSWSHANHDYMICANARYLASKTFTDIRKQLYEHNILTWEKTLYEERIWRTKHLPQGLTHGEEYLIALYVPITCTIMAYALIIVSLIAFCNDDNQSRSVIDIYNTLTICQLSKQELIIAAKVAGSLCQVLFVLLNVHCIFYTKNTRDAVRKAYNRIVDQD